MAKYKAYPEYKDSGVDSFGCIPKQWSVLRLKYIFEIKKRIAGALGFDILSVTQRGIKIKDIDSGEGQLSMDYSKYQRVLPGDFAMNHMDLLTGYIDISNYDGVTSPDYRVFSVRDSNDFYSRYFLYLLQDGYKQRRFFHLGQGSAHLGRWRLPTEAFNEILYPLPSLEEQMQIAAFLDHETAKIDNLIEKQQQLIELSKEKRQAVISHAVTKGLNPDVPMKDSGVECLRIVPQHWELSRLRYKFSFAKGLTITKENLSEEGIPCVNYGEVHSKYGFEVDPRIHPLKCVSRKYLKDNMNSLLFKGDIVFADTSEDLEGAGNFTQLISDSQVFAGYHTIIARPLKRDNRRFYAYLLDCRELRTQVRLAVKGVKVFSVTQAILRNVSIWLPPENEQQRIADFLDQKTVMIDTLINKQRYQIELLKERRTALISAAVTGKIDVRNWTAPALHEVEAFEEVAA
ncbi:restriction endonuclease subunit S [Escherichia coli]|nr:restriction endonuclease subunit S [Escherichia coli]